jgi:hypothetical protein
MNFTPIHIKSSKIYIFNFETYVNFGFHLENRKIMSHKGYLCVFVQLDTRYIARK